MNTRRDATIGNFDPFRQFIGLERDVLVLSVAISTFGFSLQMTGQYVPEYLRVLGVGATVVGFYGNVGNLIGALYPYPGGTFSDRLGSCPSLVLFGMLSSAGFLFWLVALQVPKVTLASVSPEPWFWIFVGPFLVQAWKLFGLGATLAIVKQSVSPERLAMGFTSTEIFRRIGFLLGLLITAALLTATATFVEGFRYALVVAAAFGTIAIVAQHPLYDVGEDPLDRSLEGLAQLRNDFRSLPEALQPLSVTNTLIRFVDGVVYVFFVIVATEFLEVGLTGFGILLCPDAFFDAPPGVEMVVALPTKLPISKLAERTGLRPVAAFGFSVYAIFPVLPILASANQQVVVTLFAFSGSRFVDLPAHKTLIVSPVERNVGGRVMGMYYLLRNTIVIPNATLGGWLYARDLTLVLSVTSLADAVDMAYFALRGEEFAAYASGA